MKRKEEGVISILIVDDNKEVCAATSAMLDGILNFKVIGTLYDGADLKKFLTVEQPDIILMDVSMQPMDGPEATRFVLKNYSSINVIAFSVHRGKNHVESMQKAGAKDYLLKSASLQTIIDSIQRVSKQKPA